MYIGEKHNKKNENECIIQLDETNSVFDRTILITRSGLVMIEESLNLLSDTLIQELNSIMKGIETGFRKIDKYFNALPCKEIDLVYGYVETGKQILLSDSANR